MADLLNLVAAVLPVPAWVLLALTGLPLLFAVRWRWQLSRSFGHAELLAQRNDWLQSELDRASESLAGCQLELRQLDTERAALQARAETDRSQLTRAALLEPVAAQLAGFREGLERLHRQDARDRTELQTQIRALRETSEQTQAQTLSLRTALAGNSAAKGQWGEIMLASLLEQAGLRPGQDYLLQPQLVTAGGQDRRPDAVVRLPNGRDLVIDAKVPLTREFLEDGGQADGASGARLLARLRAQLRDLAGRDYQELTDLRALELVLLFLPADALLSKALASAPTLQQEALDRGVAIVTPQTLVLVLHLIHRLWHRERVLDHAQDIARQAEQLQHRLLAVGDLLTKHARQLADAEQSGRDLNELLNHGPQGVRQQAEHLQALGLRAQAGASGRPQSQAQKTAEPRKNTAFQDT